MDRLFFRPAWETTKSTAHRVAFFAKRYKNASVFLAGFLFDALTIKRIDAWPDLAIQLLYLAGLTVLLTLQDRARRGAWQPGPTTRKVWPYNVEALHFLYGGLLSAYTILYFQSSSFNRTFFFFVFMGFLLIINEMPMVHRIGTRLRLGLYAFCVASFMIYFIPVLIGRMGMLIFLISIALSGGVVWKVTGLLAPRDPNRKASRVRLFIPAVCLLLALVVLYSFRLIPPVPLSLKYAGVFHGVRRTGQSYQLKFPKPPWYAFWRSDSRPFYFRREDAIYYFVRIFGPSRFKHDVQIRWEYFDPQKDDYVVTDVIPLSIKGGRFEGFRGMASKSRYKPGKWRIRCETEDGLLIGSTTFNVKKDKSTKERVWVYRKM